MTNQFTEEEARMLGAMEDEDVFMPGEREALIDELWEDEGEVNDGENAD